MRIQPFVLIALYVVTSQAAGAQTETDAFSEPATAYLRTFSQPHRKIFVLERFDAQGRLAGRSIDTVTGTIAVENATSRTIGGYRLSLRGLQSCPSETVTYNRVQTWNCVDAARDYAGTIYNQRASVILCKTLLLRSAPQDVTPASCFMLVGGSDGEPWRTVNDDDSMVFLGLATIGETADGRPRRPDLQASQSLSRSMGFGHAQ